MCVLLSPFVFIWTSVIIDGSNKFKHVTVACTSASLALLYSLTDFYVLLLIFLTLIGYFYTKKRSQNTLVLISMSMFKLPFPDARLQ